MAAIIGFNTLKSNRCAKIERAADKLYLIVNTENKDKWSEVPGGKTSAQPVRYFYRL